MFLFKIIVFYYNTQFLFIITKSNYRTIELSNIQHFKKKVTFTKIFKN